MNLVIDVGNTRTKIGIFEGASMKEKEVFPSGTDLTSFTEKFPVEHAIYCSVTGRQETPNIGRINGKLLQMDVTLPLPVQNRYKTPNTLGMDRLAAVCGAWSMFPGDPSLVIDAGTCINYEFINEAGDYLGGAISPGVAMRFLAMHQYTDRLPIGEPVHDIPLTGTSTLTSLQSGVMNGICEEINGVSARYRHDNPRMRVILTGGDAHFFEKLMKPPIFVAPDLVLVGLNSILLHHVNS